MPTATAAFARTATAFSPADRKALDRLIAEVNQALERVLPKSGTSPQVVHEAMRYCVFPGGKRFRPLLALGGCEAVGAPRKQALSVACALELIHTYSLVHDDLPAMDNADQRRGLPSCHRKFGEGNAILVGDALLTFAFELLSRNGTPNALAIIRVIGEACGTTGLIGGQVLDLQVISRPRSVTEQAMLDVAARKTGALIRASVMAGGLAGGATTAHVAALKRYGQEIGLAFQLIDDLHDHEGLVHIMGTEQAKAEAARLIGRATKALAPFGAKAKTLQGLAQWLAATST